MDSEILTLGDELCRGEIVDTNAAFLAERLTDLGFHVRWMSSTTDDAADVEAALAFAASRARLVLVSGGLGPTEDDRTVDAAARVLGREAVAEPRALEAMKARFGHMGFALTPNNLRQARVLAGAQALENRWGLAPGFLLSHRHATFLFMPGVPREMRPMFEEEAAPRLLALRSEWLASGEGLEAVVRHLRVFGLGESHIDHRLAGLAETVEAAGPDGVTVHYRVAYPECFVKIVVRRSEGAEATAERLAAEARARLGAHVYAEGPTTFPEAVGQALRKAGLTLAVAESCTGGLVGDLVTDVPGSSDYFLASYVTYANAAKQDLLGVREETLREHGAVSQACAAEMAEGARRRSGASLAVAITGIAGPGGGTPEKPVGTVHFALAFGGTASRTPRMLDRHFVGSRDQIKRISAYTALELVRRHALAVESLQ